MLGAIFMFLLIMGAFLWHLASETEKERGKSSSSSSNSSNYTEQSRQESMQGAARKRNRKKRKQQGKEEISRYPEDILYSTVQNSSTCDV